MKAKSPLRPGRVPNLKAVDRDVDAGKRRAPARGHNRAGDGPGRIRSGNRAGGRIERQRCDNEKWDEKNDGGSHDGTG